MTTLVLSLSIVILGGCAATNGTTADTASAATDASYSNFLVVGIAGNYDSRAHFERTVVSGLRAKGSSASTFYSVAGGNKPVTRESIRDGIASGAFDAVVLTRVLDAESETELRSSQSGKKVSTKGGRPINFFRYDYEDLEEPPSLEINTKITFATELYDAATEELVWSFDPLSSRSENLGKVIDETAETVVRQLDRKNFIKQ